MLWLILPAYNEAHALPRLISRIDEVLRQAGIAHRLVVVNDGSTDETAAVLQDMAARFAVEVIEHPLNRGLGETERDGFEYVAARCAPDDMIVRIEADDTHPPEYVLQLAERLAAGCDVAVASRFRPGGGQVGVPRSRAFVSRVANILMRLIVPIPGVREYTCGLRAYRGSVIQDALRVFGNSFIQLRGLGFTSTPEMLVKLHLLGCRFGEIPFVLRYDHKRGPSRMVGSVTTIGYAVMVVLYHWPWGGWRTQFRGLHSMYARHPEQAVAAFGRDALERRSASRIGV